jgi:hypothetical protein
MTWDAAVLERVAQRFRYDMWDSVVPEAVLEEGIEVQRFGPVQATAFREKPHVPALNQIQGAAEPGAVEEGHLAAAVEWMRAREVDYRVPVAEGRAGAGAAEAWLGGHGYERGAAWLKLVREGGPPDLPEDPAVEVFPLGDEFDGEGISSIVREALELPIMAETLVFSLPTRDDWRCYTAAILPEGDLVAAGAMLIDDGVAQLGLDATLRRGRGRGANRALLRRRLLDAAAAGCRTVFAELGECEPAGLDAAARNLRAAGFVEAYAGRNWQRPALAAVGPRLR